MEALVSSVQPANALPPIFRRPSFMVTLSRFVEPAKDDAPNSWTLPGIDKQTRPAQFWNAESPISVNVPGNVSTDKLM
jgi:hypothetical protein